jgi:ABC-type nitrate/sulfonate/bicarbonate transport system substrate-binding protein
MRRVAALLAAALAACGCAGCGEDGAEPGAPEGAAEATPATLVLDFQPNAVHTGIYAAKERGYFAGRGVDVEIREPSGTADGAKLLEAGRADFAVMDINDYGIARARGLDLLAVASIVQRPLAAVIAADPNRVQQPRDLDGGTVGVTGVPSDDAVLDTILAADGSDPGSVKRVTIGFNAVQALAAGKIDAATAFWNAEGVQLRNLGVPTREFRVDEYGAPRYPELLLVIDGRTVTDPDDSATACAVVDGLARGYDDLANDPAAALEALTGAVPDLDPAVQEAQLAELTGGRAFSAGALKRPSSQLRFGAVEEWAAWAESNGIVSRYPPPPRPLACKQPVG